MTPTPLAHASRRAVVLAFVLLYLFGGSKFLGIRFAVEHIPPALLGALRFGIAGAVMLAVCPLTGRRIVVDRTEFSRLLTLGILMLTLGNVVLFWAQQVVPSGVAALIVSSVPLWMLVHILARVSGADAWQFLSRVVLGVVVAAAIAWAYGMGPRLSAPVADGGFESRVRELV